MAKLSTADKAKLSQIAQATASGNPGFAYFAPAAVQKLVDAALVEGNPGLSQGDAIAFRATQAGMDEAKVAGPTNGAGENTAPAGHTAPTISSLVASVPVPSIRRGGEGSRSVYPFDSMEAGQSFFVPQTGDKNPAKSLASNITTVMKKGATVVAGQFRTINRKNRKTGQPETVQLPVYSYPRIFVTRAVDDGAPWGFPGQKGAAVWRTK